jgi:hypothetical protein
MTSLYEHPLQHTRGDDRDVFERIRIPGVGAPAAEIDMDDIAVGAAVVGKNMKLSLHADEDCMENETWLPRRKPEIFAALGDQ